MDQRSRANDLGWVCSFYRRMPGLPVGATTNQWAGDGADVAVERSFALMPPSGSFRAFREAKTLAIVVLSGLLIAIGTLAIGYQAVMGFPYRVWYAYVVVAGMFFGVPAFFLWPTLARPKSGGARRLRISRAGFSVDFLNAPSRTWRWDDPTTLVELVDTSESPFAPSSWPGFSVRVDSGEASPWWIPEDAYLALLDSARAAGAQVSTGDTGWDVRGGAAHLGPQVDVTHIRGSQQA